MQRRPRAKARPVMPFELKRTSHQSIQSTHGGNWDAADLMRDVIVILQACPDIVRSALCLDEEIEMVWSLQTTSSDRLMARLSRTTLHVPTLIDRDQASIVRL